MKAHPTFEVSKSGLAKLMARRGPAFAALELIQNAWDEASENVTVDLVRVGGQHAMLTVEDDNPDGFADISHAYVLFAESAKKSEAEKRGRFNLGEKLVIAICTKASISTTTGTIRFEGDTRTHHPSDRRTTGSVFSGVMPMTSDQFEEACKVIRTVIVPDGVTTTFNGEVLERRIPLKQFDEVLQSEIADEEGRLKRTWRKGHVSIYAVAEGETATIYELGIPVVATGDRWHVDVGQKVPLNVDRDNVTPAYLRDLRRAVLDNAHDLLDGDASGETWVTDAIEDEKVSPEAVNAALTARFGEKRVAYDPTDREANHLAASLGYTVVASRSLPKAAWVNVRAFGSLPPAGQVTPSPKPYDPGAEEVRKTIPEDQWTSGMTVFADFARRIAARLVNVTRLEVVFVNDQDVRNFQATWRGHRGPTARLEWNVQVLGRAYFDQSPLNTGPLSTLIHEMAHQEGSLSHFDHGFLDELARIGADFVRLALTNPAALATEGTAVA